MEKTYGLLFAVAPVGLYLWGCVIAIYTKIKAGIYKNVGLDEGLFICYKVLNCLYAEGKALAGAASL